jgi:hypothetical protein
MISGSVINIVSIGTVAILKRNSAILAALAISFRLLHFENKITKTQIVIEKLERWFVKIAKPC